MFEKAQLEKILATHGLSGQSSDDEIRTALIQAEWHMTDVDAALLVLRDNPNQHRSHQDALHQLYRTDERLRPETVRSLLGIDMQISSEEIVRKKRRSRAGITVGQVIEIALVSCLLGAFAIVASMWYMGVGIFHAGLL